LSVAADLGYKVEEGMISTSDWQAGIASGEITETFACGTGVTAVAMCMAKKKGLSGKVHSSIKVKGGELSVDFKFDGHSFTEVFLEGPATFVFSGGINV
jgi:diaminopimelate epimerase